MSELYSSAIAATLCSIYVVVVVVVVVVAVVIVFAQFCKKEYNSNYSRGLTFRVAFHLRGFTSALIAACSYVFKNEVQRTITCFDKVLYEVKKIWYLITGVMRGIPSHGLFGQTLSLVRVICRYARW